MSRDAVFLDRDGTLIEEVNYLAHPEQVRLIPGAADAVRALNAAGVLVVVVTNQAGVARGYFPEARLAAAGVTLNAVYHCPHHPTAGLGRYRVDCDCRKPKPGLLLAAARELDIDLSRAWMIGDKPCDAGAGRAAGCRTLLVRTGHGRELPEDVGAVPDIGHAVQLCALFFGSQAAA